MSVQRCSNCGRTRPEWSDDEGVSARENSRAPYGGSEGAWGSFDGRDLCSQCQTPEQRREVIQRSRDAILREIERRQREGVPPDEYEVAFINFALASSAVDDDGTNPPADPVSPGEPAKDWGRLSDPGADPAAAGGLAETVGDASDPLAGVPAGPGELARHSSGLQLRVSFTGAFLTGSPLAVPIEVYGRLQGKLMAMLNSDHWSTEGLRAQGGTYESGGGFSEPVPLVIIRREGFDLLPRLSAALEGAGPRGAPLRRLAPNLEVATPKRLAIDIYDLGVAVLAADFHVVAKAGTNADDVAREVKRLVRLRAVDGDRSPLAKELQRIAKCTATEYGKAVTAAAPTELQVRWLSRDDPTVSKGSRASGQSARTAGETGNSLQDKLCQPDEEMPDKGRLFWLHPIHVLEATESSICTERAMAPAVSRRIKVDGGVFVPGIGWSVVRVHREDAEATAIELTKLHWAYYALYMEIDRGLLEILDKPRWLHSASLKELEADANAVSADYLRISDARARLDSAINARGGDELAIWEAIAKVQKFDLLLDGVGRKLDALATVAQHRIEQTTAVRDRRIGYLLGFLGVLGLVTLVIAVVGALVGSVKTSDWPPIWERAVAVGLAFAIAFSLYWWFFIRTARAPRSRQRGKQQ